MNDNASQNISLRIFWIVLIGTILTTAGLLLYRVIVADPVQDETAEIHKEAWKRIEPHLSAADLKTQELPNRFIQRIDDFFEERKGNTDDFAESMLSWSSKWELIKGLENHRKFIAVQFSQHIFSEDEMVKLIEEATAEYTQESKALRNELLVSIQADLADLPANALPAFANEELLSNEFEDTLAVLSAEIARESQIDIGQAVGAVVMGEVLAVIINKSITSIFTRLGISAGILGTGAASSTVTFGAGIVIAVAADFIVDWIVSWFNDPIENISNKMAIGLDDLENSIISGEPETWQVYKILIKMSKNDTNSEVKSRAAEVARNIEQEGGLGLKHALNRLVEIQNQTSKQALKQLVFGESN